MPFEEQRLRLVNAIQQRPASMNRRLQELKRIGVQMRERPDLLWLLLLQSLSTLGRSVAWGNLSSDSAALQSIAYSQLCCVSPARREKRLRRVLSGAKVRFALKKAHWLAKNVIKIRDLGGLTKANAIMRSRQGYEQKIEFITIFHGVGKKYGRNIWMDIYDEDFRQSIAVDSRLDEIGLALGLWKKDSKRIDREVLLKSIAMEANVDPWDLDRLLYTYKSYFLTEISGVSEPPSTIA